MLRVYKIAVDVNENPKRASEFTLSRIGDDAPLVEFSKVDIETGLDIIKDRIARNIEESR